jgi:hypothetical protein
LENSALLEQVQRRKFEKTIGKQGHAESQIATAKRCNRSGVDAMKTPLPENEAERLNSLRRYQMLDTPPEPAFDRIAEMAVNFFRVPMAGVSLVDEDRVCFKSRLGISARETARDAGLCSSATLSQGVYYLRDASRDERAPQSGIGLFRVNTGALASL